MTRSHAANVAILGAVTLLAAAGAPACGSRCECAATPATPAPEPPPTDAEVEAGAGWTRVAPGTWRFAVDGDAPMETTIAPAIGGRAVLIVSLPSGARGATVTALRVWHAEAGEATWSIERVLPDSSPGQVLAMAPTTVAAQAWAEVPLDPPAAVADRFAVVFTPVSGAPAVGALARPLAEARALQAAPDGYPFPLDVTPLVRVTLSGVH